MVAGGEVEPVMKVLLALGAGIGKVSSGESNTRKYVLEGALAEWH